MKKILLLTIAILGLNMAVSAQTDSVQKAKPVTIENLSEKLDKFIDVQNETNERLEGKVNKTLQSIQNVNNSGSTFRRIFEESIPLMVITIIGLFLIGIVFVFTKNNYNNNKLKYDAMLKCAEQTGSVPDFFNSVEKHRASMVSTAGRVHLVLSLVCGVIATIFVICAIGHGRFWNSLTCAGAGVVFAMAAVVLFTQYNRFSENSRINKE